MTDTPKPPVVITEFQAENYKRLKAIRIAPGVGVSVVPIVGKNEAGKSSILDAIAATLGGKSYAPEMPVRAGESEAATRMVLSNGLIIRRIFNPDGTGSVVVENGEGMRAGSPQAVLDKLFAGVAFDPIGFMREKPADQLAIMRGLVKLDVDVDEMARLNKADYDERRDVNRDLKSAEGALAQMPMFEGLPAEPVDEAALETTIASAAETNGGIERRRLSRENFVAALEGNKEKRTQLQAQIAEMQRDVEEYDRVIAEQEAKIAGAEPLPDPVDVSAAQEQLRQARETNQRIQAMRVADAQKKLVDSLSGKSTTLTARMEERDAAVAKAFETANMPVPGLTFADDALMLDGVPLSQASTGRKLRVSTAIGIAMSPELRVMLVRDASLLDDDGYAALCEMGEQHGMQLWIESVGRPDSVGIIIEDGEVKGADAPPPIDKGKRRVKKQPDAIAVMEEASAEPEPVHLPPNEVDDEDPPFDADEQTTASVPAASLFDYD